jgi:hypothetical protein
MASSDDAVIHIDAEFGPFLLVEHTRFKIFTFEALLDNDILEFPVPLSSSLH